MVIGRLFFSTVRAGSNIFKSSRSRQWAIKATHPAHLDAYFCITTRNDLSWGPNHKPLTCVTWTIVV